ncbi:MAG: type III-B CRISPR module-associated protein Cmr5 [Chloroflexi bacterium]|nr:type III-B CRISPR module-associated protein Cmr5 [Chloroflexota bacterium]
MTRQQQYLLAAMQHIELMTQSDRAVKDIYGGLCHTLPVLIRTNGLCQTLAFVEEKASGNGERARAYQALRTHVAATIGIEPSQLLDRIRSADLGDYLRYTRTLLEAWVYYKRLAVSILEVEAGGGGGVP